MGRSGYSEGIEEWDLIRWRGAVKSAIRGKRGQAFLREMLDALDAMPEKRLISGSLIRRPGDDPDYANQPCGVCAIGALGVARGIEEQVRAIPQDWDDDGGYVDNDVLAEVFGVARALACEVQFINDEACYRPETDEQRWQRVRDWVESEIETEARV